MGNSNQRLMDVNLKKLKYTEEPRVKERFWASDFNKTDLDLYFAWTGEPVTNPPEWNDTLKWGAGNGVEDAMLKVLKMNGIVQEDYDQNIHGAFRVEREGITVSGRTDARTIDGFPIEIKSVNNKNTVDVREYERGYPRENYVGQLAIYMDVLGVDTGYLFVSTIDGLHTFWFKCKRLASGKYKCGKITVDVNSEYKRWAKLYKENVVPRVMPDPFQYLYKYDVEKLDWKSLKITQIANARANRAVIGDYQLRFSNWKDKIIKMQGTRLGYSNKELAIIQEKTGGYTTWFKKSKKVSPTPIEED